jgi:hypothetical protein
MIPHLFTPPRKQDNALAGLGRIPQPDSRNEKFRLAKPHLPPGVRTRAWNFGAVLDQGDTPQCVGYATKGYLKCGPITNPTPSLSPTDLYHKAQQNDEWPGEDYDGSSTLGAMKTLMELGLIGEYRWAFDVDTIFAHVLAKGPVMMGTWWTMDMFPTTGGWLMPTGETVGGHEWVIVGANLDKVCPYDDSVGALRMVNSWGPSWNENGRAWVSRKAAKWLLETDGEAVTPTEIKVIA